MTLDIKVYRFQIKGNNKKMKRLYRNKRKLRKIFLYLIIIFWAIALSPLAGAQSAIALAQAPVTTNRVTWIGTGSQPPVPLNENGFTVWFDTAGQPHIINNSSVVTDLQLSISATAPLNKSGNTISIPVATDLINGYLSATDHAAFIAHITSTSNPHSVTKTQVGLSNVTNDAQFAINNNLSEGNAGTIRTNLSLVPGINIQSYSARLTEIATIGSGLQLPRVNSGATGLEYFTISFPDITGSVTDAQVPNNITITDFSNAGHTHENTTNGGQLNATSVFSTGTVPTARLGSGTANSSSFLRGDQTWQVITSGITGSGTTNFIPKFSSPSAVTDSTMREVSGSFGINIAAPLAKLHVSHATATASAGQFETGNGASDSSLPTDVSVPTLRIGGQSYFANRYIGIIGFGYQANNIPAATISYFTTDGSGNLKGRIELATRNSTGNVLPTTRLTINPDGTCVFGISASAPQLISTVSTGTKPIDVTSTTKVDNLNVDQVDGGDWASPLAIGSTAANTVAATKFIGSGSTPGSAAGAGAGTSPSGLTVVGNDVAMIVSITTGTSTPVGNVVNITFVTPYTNAPVPMISAGNRHASTHQIYITTTTTGASIVTPSGFPLTDSTDFIWNVTMTGK